MTGHKRVLSDSDVGLAEAASGSPKSIKVSSEHSAPQGLIKDAEDLLKEVEAYFKPKGGLYESLDSDALPLLERLKQLWGLNSNPSLCDAERKTARKPLSKARTLFALWPAPVGNSDDLDELIISVKDGWLPRDHMSDQESVAAVSGSSSHGDADHEREEETESGAEGSIGSASFHSERGSQPSQSPSGSSGSASWKTVSDTSAGSPSGSESEGSIGQPPLQ